MSSQKDILESIIALVIIALFGVLVITGHATGNILVLLTTCISAIVAWFFTKSGFGAGVASVQPQPPTVQPDLTSLVETTVQSVLANIGKQPATVSGVLPSDNSSQVKN